jgi:hypothetical protein
VSSDRPVGSALRGIATPVRLTGIDSRRSLRRLGGDLHACSTAGWCWLGGSCRFSKKNTVVAAYAGFYRPRHARQEKTLSQHAYGRRWFVSFS